MKKTEIWQKYEKCKNYMDGKSIVSKTERNWNFYIGRQWEGIKTGGQELPMLNFIKPIVQYKVSSVAQNAMTAVYSDMEETGFFESSDFSDSFLSSKSYFTSFFFEEVFSSETTGTPSLVFKT